VIAQRLNGNSAASVRARRERSDVAIQGIGAALDRFPLRVPLAVAMTRTHPPDSFCFSLKDSKHAAGLQAETILSYSR
jgi:hypothetical protein